MNMQPGRIESQANNVCTETLSTSGIPIPHGDSVRLQKLGGLGFEAAPNRLYLVYMRFDEENKLSVLHMETDPLIDGDVAATEAHLLGKARAGGGGPEQVGRDFEKMIFKGPTYFTVVIDNVGWGFLFPAPGIENPPGVEAYDPIVFIEKKKTLIERPGNVLDTHEQIYSRNKSFYNAEPVGIEGMAAVRCINFFRDEQGVPLGDQEPLLVGFEIYVQVPYSLSAAEQRKLTVIIDPDGENQGPPR